MEYRKTNIEDRLCRKCKQMLSGHKRCAKCNILLHPRNPEYNCRCGVQHTLRSSKNKKYCQNCYDNNKKIR